LLTCFTIEEHMRSIYFLLPLAALGGCAMGPSLQSRMAAYMGDTSQALVQSLGVPDKQITTGGVQYLAYDVRHEEQIEPNDFAYGGFGDPFGGPFYPGGLYGGVYASGLPQQVQDWTCTTTFMLKNDKVFNFSLRGNDCG
jgi:hypothetical protein